MILRPDSKSQIDSVVRKLKVLANTQSLPLNQIKRPLVCVPSHELRESEHSSAENAVRQWFDCANQENNREAGSKSASKILAMYRPLLF